MPSISGEWEDAVNPLETLERNEHKSEIEKYEIIFMNKNDEESVKNEDICCELEKRNIIVTSILSRTSSYCFKSFIHEVLYNLIFCRKSDKNLLPTLIKLKLFGTRLCIPPGPISF